jgi:hypothetical protein
VYSRALVFFFAELSQIEEARGDHKQERKKKPTPLQARNKEKHTHAVTVIKKESRKVDHTRESLKQTPN